MSLHPCLQYGGIREERANVGDRKGLCYKFGVSGGWKSTQEMYELIRREMIEMADVRLAHSASCCKSEAHRLQRQGRTTQWRDVYGEMGVESGLSLSECARAPCWCEVHEQRGANVYRMVG
jgi:hypothetical protein